MKILVLAQTFPLNPLDGTAHFMLDFCEGLVKTGEEVMVLLPYHPYFKPKSFKRFKVLTFKYFWPERLHLLGYGQTLVDNQTFKWFVWLLAPFYYLFGMIALFRAVRQFRIDLVSAHWILPNGFIAGVVRVFTKVPYAVTLPGSDVYVSRLNLLFNLMARFSLKNASKVLSNSTQLLKDLKTNGEVTAYGVPVNNGRRIKNDKLLIAAAGRRVANKNFAMLLEIDPSIEIISGLTIDEFRKKLLGVDIFVAPSIRDKSGNLDDGNVVVLEAMTAGCAVITSDLPGYRIMIENGVSGLLVQAGDKKKTEKAINLLKKNALLRHKLGMMARERVKRYFTLEKVGAFYRRVFEEAIIK